MSGGSDQEDMYGEILRLGGATIPSIIETIRTADGAGDTDRLTIEVHGAKGSLATGGAMALSVEAEALEKACHAKDMAFVEMNLPGFLEGMQKLCDNIQGVFELFVSPATTLYGDVTQLRVRLHKLTLALSGGDAEGVVKNGKSGVTRDFGGELNAHIAVPQEMVDRKD